MLSFPVTRITHPHLSYFWRWLPLTAALSELVFPTPFLGSPYCQASSLLLFPPAGPPASEAAFAAPVLHGSQIWSTKGKGRRNVFSRCTLCIYFIIPPLSLL